MLKSSGSLTQGGMLRPLLALSAKVQPQGAACARSCGMITPWKQASHTFLMVRHLLIWYSPQMHTCRSWWLVVRLFLLLPQSHRTCTVVMNHSLCTRCFFGIILPSPSRLFYRVSTLSLITQSLRSSSFNRLHFTSFPHTRQTPPPYYRSHP